MEEFKPIEGFPGYRVSREGMVQSCWNRLGRRGRMTEEWLPLKPIRRACGHYVVCLHKEGKKTPRYIHRLVLEAFSGPRPEGLVCCHWDGDPSNNRLTNLRWDTQKSNAADAIRHGRRKFGEEAGSVLLVDQVVEIRRLHGERVPIGKLAADYGVSWPAIQKIVKGLAWRHLLPSFDPQNPTSPMTQ